MAVMPRPAPVVRPSPLSGAVAERMLGLAGLALLGVVGLYLGRAVAAGSLLNATALAVLPALVVVLWIFVMRGRKVLLYVALGMNLVPFLGLTGQALVGPIYLADVVVVLVLLTWLADRLTGGSTTALPRTPLIGWPLALFGVALIPGLVTGADRYGASFFGQPARLVFYAAIVGALTRLSAREAYRGIVIVFYTGAILQALAAVYYIATGGSATNAFALSTGGSRVLALSTAMYLTGALVVALVNLQLDPGRRVLHLIPAASALFGIIVAYGRTTYAAAGLIVVGLFFALRELRKSIALSLPFIAPVAVIVALLLPSFAPDLISTFTGRINPSISTDTSFRWREQAVDITLAETADDRILGGGFGATRVFSSGASTHVIGGDPHNSYVFLLGGGGVVALAAFSLLLFVYVLDAAWRFYRGESIERALIAFSATIVFVFAVNMFTGPILTVPTLVLTFWAALLLPSLVPRRPRSVSR